MTDLKLTVWNIEHLGRLLAAPEAGDAPRRMAAIVGEIRAIDPDVLCIVEGPGSLPDLRAWVAAPAPAGLGGGWRVAVIPGTEAALEADPDRPRRALASLYAMQGNDTTGNQWIWYLVRDGLFEETRAQLLAPVIWQRLTGGPTWPVHDWGRLERRTHRHWRHPQVLSLRLGDVELELIGVHLKSKINRLSPFDGDGDLRADYVEEALRARVRLATEAHDVRRYVDARFAQERAPRLVVMGDLNDGPGRGLFEREFLFFDLVSNIQGDVFFATRFLNHALFDFPDHLRWTTAFNDRVEAWSRQRPGIGFLPAEPIDPTRMQLIDHILFTQGLVGEGARPRVRAEAGLIEHTIHDRINAPLPVRLRTSDHRPVSVTLSL